MAFEKAVARRPRWYLVPVRVVLLSVIVTLLSFAVGLFLGIVGVLVGSTLRGVSPNMAMAYRHFAGPLAGASGGVALIAALVMEVRHYRQARALSGIEQASQ